MWKTFFSTSSLATHPGLYKSREFLRRGNTGSIFRLSILNFGFFFSKPQLLYFGTNEIGTAKQNFKDLFPYMSIRASLSSNRNKKLKVALVDADLAFEK